MVHGLKSKSKNETSVSREYLIHLKEIKPWPVRRASKHPSSVTLQWERGDKCSGSTKSVAPSLWERNQGNKIVFNEELRLAVTLFRQPESKSMSKNGRFQKRTVVFSLIDANGQFLARGILDLAQYAALGSVVMVTLPLTMGKNGVIGDGRTPALFLSIKSSDASMTERVDQRLKGTSLEGGSSKRLTSTIRIEELASTESRVPALMNGDEDEDGDEDEIHSFIDDDDSPCSSSHRSDLTAEISATTTIRRPGVADQTKVDISAVEKKLPNVQALRASSAAAASAYASKNNRIYREEDNSSIISTKDLFSEALSPGTQNLLTPTPLYAQSPAIITKISTIPLSSPPLPQMFSAVASNLEDNTEDLRMDQAARTKLVNAKEERNEKLDHKAFIEIKVDLAAAETKAAATEYKVKQLESRIENLEGELADVAAVEVALYCVVAQHGSSSQKVHCPARRMARLYMHACKNWSQDRRASCARSCVSGLVLVARACGNDVTRLSFWLSNVIVLREMISQAFDIASASPTSLNSKLEKCNKPLDGRSKNNHSINSSIIKRIHGLQEPKSSHSGANDTKGTVGPITDWREPSTFAIALKNVEEWIFGRIIESVWWQVMTPPMQKAAEVLSQKSFLEDGWKKQKTLKVQKAAQVSLAQDLRAIHQGNFCLELWKSAFVEVSQRICPVRAGGHECGCLRRLTKMILEQCMSRLDVAMLNAILRDPDEWAPTDPIADPIVDRSVLPIRAGRLSFGGGAQLKIAIRTWSSWIATLTAGDGSIKVNSTEPHPEIIEGNEIGKEPAPFPLLRTMADLLMLPKDMLMDKSVRKEVCPSLSLPLLKKILENFVPDDFSPDPVSPSLLAAINAEIVMEKQMNGQLDTSSASPAIVNAPLANYVPPPSSYVRGLIGDATSRFLLGRSSSSLLRKSHTSDDELDELDSPLTFMMDLTLSKPRHPDMKVIQSGGLTSNGASDETLKEFKMEPGFFRRYQLLKEVWYTH